MREFDRRRRHTGNFKTIGRDLPNGDYIEIEAGEDDGSGGLSPGFVITGAVWEKRGTLSGRMRSRNGHGMPRDWDFAGPCHDQIIEAAPELAPLVTAHLAANNGTPMHAVSNGWHFYSGASAAYERKHYGEEFVNRQGANHDRGARALHVAPEDLPEGLDRKGFEAFAATLTDHWWGQAQAARAALDAMVDGDGVEGR